MTSPIRPSEHTLIEVRQALQQIELNRRTAPQHNFIATDDPDVDNDESEGYSHSSWWYNGDPGNEALFLCTDATKSAANWEPLGNNGIIGGAPIGAQYVVLAGSATLTQERILTAGEGIDITDAGAGSTLTIDGEDATTANKGIASFNASDFSVSSGAVSLATPIVRAAADLTDLMLVRGAGSRAIKTSGVQLTDADAMSGLTQLTVDQLRLDGQVISSTSGDVQIQPVADADVELTPTGTGSANINVAAGDVNISTISGEIEFQWNGLTVLEILSAKLRVADDNDLNFGNGDDASLRWAVGAGRDHLQLGLAGGTASQTGYFSIVEQGDLGHANREPAAAAADPVLRIYSSDAATGVNDYLEFYHNRSNPVIDWGAGTLQLGSTGSNVNVSGNLTLDGMVDGVDVASHADRHVTGGADALSVLGFFNGTFLESFDALVTSDGAKITMTLTNAVSGDLTMVFSDGLTTLDLSGSNGIIDTDGILVAGSDTSPQDNYVYILKSAKVLAVSTSDWPTAEHIKVGYFFIPSIAFVQGNGGAYVNQNWNDHAADQTTDVGHLNHLAERVRSQSAIYKTGVDLTVTIGGGGTTVDFAVTAGVIYQMHKHATPVLDTSTGDLVLVVNQNGAAYDDVTDLESLTDDSTGTALKKYFNWVVWCTGNKTGEFSSLMLNLPDGSYNKLSDAIADVGGYDVFSMPAAFNTKSSTGFLLARLTFQLSGGVWTLENTVELRGSTPQSVTGGGIGGAQTEFADNQFSLFDESDVTKILDFQLSGITTATTRTITMADQDLDLTPGTGTYPLSTDVLLKDGSVALTAPWDAGSFKITTDSLDTVGDVTVGGDLNGVDIDDLIDVDTATDAPALNQVLKWDGSNWVPGTAGDTSEFTFSIDSFVSSEADANQLIGSGTWKTSGNLQFLASYSNAPGGMTALVTMTGTATGWSTLAMVPVTGGSPPGEPTVANTSYPASAGDTVTFTLTQSADASTAVDTVQFNNTMRYGNSALTQGNQTEASLEALTEVAGPNESRSQTINNIATTANYLVFGYADRLSDVAQVQMNSGDGYVTAAFAAAATTLAPDVQSGVASVDNSAGYSETFACITSLITGLADGVNDFKLLTTSTAINYLYWGELNKASGYTEADVEDNIATQPGKVASNSISSRSMIVNAAVDEYTYIAYPARLGALSSIVIGGFESIGDFTVDSTTLAITNDAGFQENYRVYVSNNPGFTDPTTMTVSL
ncbi:MAG: hypothetical protein V3V96_14700 [Acidiferrobacterales bacterium]